MHIPSGLPVLIMDDEEDIRTLTLSLLSELGFQAQACCNGEEAVESYKKSWESGSTLPIVMLDLLVADGMGGDEAARRILSINPDARLIVSSGYSNIPIMTDYKNYGFRAAMPKPYNTDTLLHVLQHLQDAT